ncbi:hypothetical protein CFI11_04890 [Thalassococcus sp. S3]|nr:hypothetical protein CFI11_04890 [Thalassococcus sp. S3]
MIGFVVALSLPDPAFAYVGPGAGLTAIGTALALILAIGLAIVGFIWFPVKRMLRKRRQKPADHEATVAKAESSQ